ncbi:UDP-N-acetylenolpyruvoylglucosamine reductase [Caldalkalibacillus thermarum TA2.A1]|uniref:UDP-N-acetylenolpyruvoylglucosamine reductase n=1 Tax=Caldalkalibacillus thermarum (strain TA2.A1) TaxID=986075 RepID=F5L901_CALTT|nr:UDP-N-acetylmuramate dehydrogenase [Caldalkalibacillus thermarum]EGL82175.1 UDP-N-acetylenolpyruvoylglucosamine reductase [Caldalkalibacillus thermarum TA2.A1]QZT33111.1 UDP-N-acetylmuramate dehydrogenase [Caldalkalibacillus thermarum TA2.A1]
MNDIVERLKEANVGKVWLNEPLKNHTTWKIGGPADILIQPKNKTGLITAVNILKAQGMPYRVIGRGSNLLVRDGGIRGAVIKVGEGLDYLRIEGEKVTAGAGFSFIKLATIIAKQGLSGLEFAGGIPGTVGGAVYMNAGAHGSDVSRVLHSAQILFDDGELATLSNEELKFSYRTSILQNERKGICLEATFKLKKGDREQILKTMAQNKDYRKQTQPLQQPCCGSVFRNPKPYSAGRLIEEAGLKGFRIGDAQISTKHANFIVNLGNATAKDVLALIKHIQHTIAEKYGVEMHPEVEVVGEE